MLAWLMNLGFAASAAAAPIPVTSPDTHDPGVYQSQVVRESHYKRLGIVKKRGAIERADLLAEALGPNPQARNDDEVALMVYLADESQVLASMIGLAHQLLKED